MKETDILVSICEYLSWKKYFFWRNNVIPVYSVKNQAFIRMPKFSRTGLPDIIIIRSGKAIGIEVKNEKGKQSDNQKQIEKEWKNAGGEYHIVRSIEQIKDLGF